MALSSFFSWSFVFGLAAFAPLAAEARGERADIITQVLTTAKQIQTLTMIAKRSWFERGSEYMKRLPVCGPDHYPSLG